MHPLLLRLADGSPGAIGAARAVAQEIADDPARLGVVVDGLASDGLGVRNRAAWALDTATRRHPDRLAPHAEALLAAAEADRAGGTLRRLLPGMLAAVRLDAVQARRLLAWAAEGLDEIPVAELANRLDALGSVAIQHPALAPEIVPRAHAALDHPAPSVRARARHVGARLDRHGLTPSDG